MNRFDFLHRALVFKSWITPICTHLIQGKMVSTFLRFGILCFIIVFQYRFPEWFHCEFSLAVLSEGFDLWWLQRGLVDWLSRWDDRAFVWSKKLYLLSTVRHLGRAVGGSGESPQLLRPFVNEVTRLGDVSPWRCDASCFIFFLERCCLHVFCQILLGENVLRLVNLPKILKV